MASESFSPVEETDLEEDDEDMSLYCLGTKLEDDDVLQNSPSEPKFFVIALSSLDLPFRIELSFVGGSGRLTWFLASPGSWAQRWCWAHREITFTF